MPPKFERVPSIKERVQDTLSVHRNELLSLLSRYVDQGKGLLQCHHLIDEVDNIVCDEAARKKFTEGPFSEVLRTAQEAIVLPPFVAIAIRPRPGVWEYVRVSVHELSVEQLTVSEYLKFKEKLVDGQSDENFVLELDFRPFNATLPRPTRSSYIGNGVQFLNRHLSSIMFRNNDCLEPLLDFLRAHRHKGHVIMLNERIQQISKLEAYLGKAEDYLLKLPPDTPYSEFEYEYIGTLSDPSKPIIFSMARLDRVKNITGLVESYGKCSELRELANLVIVAGYLDVNKSKDKEEIGEIERMHSIIKEHNLDGQIRWIASQTNSTQNGELYRYIADKRGIFVQPALFEAFGLTVVEAMTCGLPSFATCHGGPLEIIENGVSVFHIDPYHPDKVSACMLDFFQKCDTDPSYWVKISEGGLKRVNERFSVHSKPSLFHFSQKLSLYLRCTSTCSRYTWKIYSERLMTLAGVYGFWKYVSKLES